jgi:D-glutamate N-acetyltransferase
VTEPRLRIRPGERVAVFADGWFATDNGKAGHALLRYGPRPVVAVIDREHAGRTAVEVVPYAASEVPIVATVAEAASLGAEVLAIGVAPSGGKLPPEWRRALLEALELGLHVEAGLHDELGADPALRQAAARTGRELRDLRVAPGALSTPTGEGSQLPVRIVHAVGSDCAIGKMTAVLELNRAAEAAGERTVFVPTGQVGVSVAGWGIAVDHVIADYVAGAAEQLVIEGATRGDTLLVEGQGALYHPAYSGVTLGLLHGCTPHVLVLCHLAGATAVDEWPHVLIPPLAELAATYEAIAAPIRPAPVAAIMLNTRHIAEEDEARAACARVEQETGRVCDDPVRFGADRLWQAVAAALPAR